MELNTVHAQACQGTTTNSGVVCYLKAMTKLFALFCGHTSGFLELFLSANVCMLSICMHVCVHPSSVGRYQFLLPVYSITNSEQYSLFHVI